MPQHVLSFAPRNAREAAEIFGALSRLAGEGRAVRALIVESPFRPGELIEHPGRHSSMSEIESIPSGEETLALLSHSSMNEIHEVSRPDLLAVVGGGVTFGAFIDAVREAGLYFPHEPDARTRDATIAEIIMDGTRFSTEGRYGRLRESVLSLELAVPKGDVVRCGSRSVKDVTSYDIPGFLMGGGGLCGMIARATLRLLPARGTRLDFLCAGGLEGLAALAGEIHRKLDCAFLEMFHECGSAPRRARLAGELQSAVGGREEALLESLSALAPKDVLVLKVDHAEIEECRRMPDALIALLNEGRRLLHVSSSCALEPAPSAGALSSMSLYPLRFHYYISESHGLPELPATGGEIRVETIETRDGRLFRRRMRGDEIVDAAKGRESAESPVTEELARRIHRVFDPQGIMLP
jgi:FAD/FMN-containing dehydrogenase